MWTAQPTTARGIPPAYLLLLAVGVLVMAARQATRTGVILVDLTRLFLGVVRQAFVVLFLAAAVAVVAALVLVTLFTGTR